MSIWVVGFSGNGDTCLDDATALYYLISPWTRWPPFRRRTFSNAFSQNVRISIQISLKSVPKGPELTISQHFFGSGNGLVPNKRQAIIWTNVGPVHWCIYVALGGDEWTLKVLRDIPDLVGHFEWLNTLRLRQNGRHFANTFRSIFMNENVWI